MGGAVGMTAASTRTRVCGPFRTSCSADYSAGNDVVSEAAAAMPTGLAPATSLRQASEHDVLR